MKDILMLGEAETARDLLSGPFSAYFGKEGSLGRDLLAKGLCE